MPFFDEYEEQERQRALGTGGQNDTASLCQFCGYASDDVIIGVCGECAVRLPPLDGREAP